VQTGLVPIHVPFWQESLIVAGLPSSQTVPFVLFDQEVVLCVGLQTWQAFAGFTLPDG
jgi:hypothetical protein